MYFTALHRALGENPGPITEEMLNAAMEASVQEARDLDWKDRLPPIKNLASTDVPKDVAAMANAGGGVIIYGVDESDKKATGRSDAGTYGEASFELFERAYKQVAIAQIHPPVFGVELVEIAAKPLAVAAIVPASVDGPHLIYKQDFFAAPVRNGADTVWMREGDIARMYRARFDEQRNATEALEQLYADAATAADGERAWVVCVARPRLARVGERFSVDDVGRMVRAASAWADGARQISANRPLPTMDSWSWKVGLRRWVYPNFREGSTTAWQGAVTAVHHDGSVSISAAVGGPPRVVDGRRDGHFGGDQVYLDRVEATVLDACALAREVAAKAGLDEYEVQVGIEWSGPLRILGRDWDGGLSEMEGSVKAYRPVRVTLRADAGEADFYRQVYELVEDCVHQAACERPVVLRKPKDD